MTASNFACDCRAAGPSCSLTLLTTPQSAPQSWAGPRALLGSLQREESRWSPSAATRWKTTTAGSMTSSATTGWLTSHTPLSLTRLGGDLVCLGMTIIALFREVAKKYGMLDPVAKDNAGIPLTCRWVNWFMDHRHWVYLTLSYQSCVRYWPWQDSQAESTLPRHHWEELWWDHQGGGQPPAHCQVRQFISTQ